jgi:hypothetical protein
MVTQIDNVRIQNRFDSLAEWQKEGVELLPGEIALVRLNAGETSPIDGKTLDEPTVSMKVGDEETVTLEDSTTVKRAKSFDALPWLSAKSTGAFTSTDTEGTEAITRLEEAVWGGVNFVGESVDYPDSSTTIKIKDGKNADGTDKTKVHAVKEGDAVTFEGKLVVFVNTMWSELGGLVYAAGDINAWRARLNYAATPEATASATTFVDKVTQYEGKISVSRKKIPEASDTTAGIVTLGVPGGAAAFNAVSNLAESVTDISHNYLHITDNNELAVGADNRNEFKEIIFDCGGPEED